MYKYIFPKIKDCEHFTLQEQMAKINEEAYELQCEVLADKRRRGLILYEGMNVIHAVETLFRSLEATEQELDTAATQTRIDNSRRGYYDEQ